MWVIIKEQSLRSYHVSKICVDFRNVQFTLEMEVTIAKIIILLVTIPLPEGISLLLIININLLHKVLLKKALILGVLLPFGNMRLQVKRVPWGCWSTTLKQIWLYKRFCVPSLAFFLKFIYTRIVGLPSKSTVGSLKFFSFILSMKQYQYSRNYRQTL